MHIANRKAGRELIAKEMCAVAAKFNATVERHDYPGTRGANTAYITLIVKLGPIAAMIDIDATLTPLTGMIHWHPGPDWIEGSSLSTQFLCAIGDPELRHVRNHKATSHGMWGVLAAYLQAGLRHAANGTAIRAERGTALAASHA